MFYQLSTGTKNNKGSNLRLNFQKLDLYFGVRVSKLGTILIPLLQNLNFAKKNIDIHFLLS